MNIKKNKLIIFVLALIFGMQVFTVKAQGDYLKGKIIEKNSAEIVIQLENGETKTIPNSKEQSLILDKYSAGDNIILQGDFITDFNRTGYLLFLFILFSLFSILVGKKYGLYSLIGMAFSFFMIFKFILPQIMAGRSPVLIVLLSAIFIIPITFYLSHGFNKKTHVAIFSTLIVLFIISIFTALSINLAKLTGYSSDEAMFLQIADQSINMKGILLAGIIIGFLGILDDVTISQSSVITQLKKADRNLSTMELYKKGMEIGHDHISSMINTLVLVYAGASMPLLLMFIKSPQPIGIVINNELIADEIIRTLIGSIGLILAVPISTFISAIASESE